MRVLVCGSRSYDRPLVIEVFLDGLLALFGDGLVLIEGCAPGADRAACEWGKAHLPTDRHLHYPAEWDKHRPADPGRKNPAGPIRNRRMLNEGKPQVVWAFSDDLQSSRGTKDMVTISKEAGVPTYVVARL